MVQSLSHKLYLLVIGLLVCNSLFYFVLFRASLNQMDKLNHTLDMVMGVTYIVSPKK